MGSNGLVSFFVGAHADDWQLFAGNMVRDDVHVSKARVVLVYITAGDAGNTDGWWEARELGSIASTVLLCGHPSEAESRPIFEGRPITRRIIGRTSSYFLRLPDGRLTDLKHGISSLTTVDNSTEYNDWESLVSVVRSVLKFEAGDHVGHYPWINTHEYLIDPFPGEKEWLDHPDHSATGDIVRSAAKGEFRTLYWAGYDDTRRRQWVSDEDYRYKQSLMIEYSRAIRQVYKKRGDYEGEVKDFYDGLMRYTYVRTEAP
jgi:hypothetical protein